MARGVLFFRIQAHRRSERRSVFGGDEGAFDSPQAVRHAFRKLETQRPDALLLTPTPRFNVLRREICQSAANIRLPIIGFSDEWALDGALLSFGPSFVEAYRRAARPP